MLKETISISLHLILFLCLFVKPLYSSHLSLSIPSYFFFFLILYLLNFSLYFFRVYFHNSNKRRKWKFVFPIFVASRNAVRWNTKRSETGWLKEVRKRRGMWTKRNSNERHVRGRDESYTVSRGIVLRYLLGTKAPSKVMFFFPHIVVWS